MKSDAVVPRNRSYSGLLYAVGVPLLVAAPALFILATYGRGFSDCQMLFPLISGLFYLSYAVVVIRGIRSQARFKPRVKGFCIVFIGGFFLLSGGWNVYRFIAFQSLGPCQKGVRLLEACNSRQCAEKQFRKAEREGVDRNCLPYGWGVLSYSEKDYDAAEGHLRTVIESDPGLNDARYWLSLTYQCMGKEDDARNLLEEYLKHHGGSYTSRAREALKKYF